MPSRQLSQPSQVEDWLIALGNSLTKPATLTLIGSGALLWHAARLGIQTTLPQASMDVDPISNDEEVINHCYESLIGSEFELEHGWHVNIMPFTALAHLPKDWQTRASKKNYAFLTAIVPAPQDLIVPKKLRGEPRDLAHIRWAEEFLIKSP